MDFLADMLLTLYVSVLILCTGIGLLVLKHLTWAECVFWPIVMVKWCVVSLYTVVTS